MKQYRLVSKHFAGEQYASSLMIAKLDVSQFQRLSREQKIEDIPILRVYSSETRGEFVEHDGEFDAEAMIAFIEKHVHPKMKRDMKPVPKRPKKRGIM